MDRARILVADDHPLMLKTIRDFITERGYEVVGTAADGPAILDSILKLSPDIAFIDNQMPHLSGLEVARQCFENNFNSKIVLISFDTKINSINTLKSLHLAGYLLKDSIINEFETCVETVMKGEHYLSQKIREQQIQEINQLTPSEKKILKLIAQENSLSGLHERLFMNESQWEEMIRALLKKLHLKSEESLLMWIQTNKSSL